MLLPEKMSLSPLICN